MPRPLLLALVASLLVARGSVAAEPSPAAVPSDPLAWPEIRQETKPWTRWWWFGGIADEASITSELEKYAAAGLGGLELTPIYGVRGDEARFVPFLSPRWMELLAHTLAEARRLDLGLDLATGTGWPFGGPWLEPADAAQYLAHRVYTVAAGERLAEPIAFTQTALVRTAGPRRVALSELREPIPTNDNLQELALDQVRFQRPLPLVALLAFPRERGTGVSPVDGTPRQSRDGGASIRESPTQLPTNEKPYTAIPLDLTARVRADGTLDWTAPAGSGEWTLYALFQGQHGKMVERAAPGGEGYALDHFSAGALEHYLARFDRAFEESHLSGDALSGVRAFFNDSYEVDDGEGDADWTPRFFEEFERRRGYDLRARLPELFGGASADRRARVLSDYRETLSDLLLDEFTLPWRDWAHRHGALIRNQAHNAPANILDLYAASDIPEQEGNGFLAIKLASSAAHVTGKRLASAETATWLNEHFLTSLAELKANTDEFLLAGINHVCYHGTPFSPPDDPWPGFHFYASVELSPTNPLWHDFPALNAYVARAQSLLQPEPDWCHDRNSNPARASNRPDEDVLLYYNIHDRWAEPDESLPHFGHGGRDPMGVGAGAVAAALHDAGFGFDYISDRQLESVEISENGSLAIRHGRPAAPLSNASVPQDSRARVHTDVVASHRAIVVPPTTFMPTATLARLAGFADGGGSVVFLDRLPTSAPGLRGREEQPLFDQLIDRIRAFIESERRKPKARAGQILVGSEVAPLLTRVPGLAPERLRVFGIEHVRRRLDGRTLYFIVNRSPQPIDGWIPFGATGRAAALFDPMTGATGFAAIRTAGSNGSAGVSPAGGPGSGHDAPASTEVYLQLPPGASCFVVLQADPSTGRAWDYYRPLRAAEPRPLPGEWSVAFIRGGPVLPNSAKLESPDGRLPSWTDFAGETGRAFSGTAVFSTELSRPKDIDAAVWQLDLGVVCDSARVRLNGRGLAVLIQPPWRVAIPKAWLRDRNNLEVEVTNLAANRIADLDRRGVDWKKFYNANLPPRRRENAGPDGQFTAAHWSPRNSGLLGPVTLTPMESFDPSQLLPHR